MKTSGERPKETRVSAQLEMNAIIIPQHSELIFITFIPIVEDVSVLINEASTERRDVSVPALFSGKS